jgi:hypothetical protein
VADEIGNLRDYGAIEVAAQDEYEVVRLGSFGAHEEASKSCQFGLPTEARDQNQSDKSSGDQTHEPASQDVRAGGFGRKSIVA